MRTYLHTSENQLRFDRNGKFAIRTNASVSGVKKSQIGSTTDNESFGIKYRVNDSNRSAQKSMDLLKHRFEEIDSNRPLLAHTRARARPSARTSEE